MKRTYTIHITCSLDEAYDLLEKSGNSILGWQKKTGNQQHHYLEWKQGIWSLSGSAVIIARLEKVRETETDIIIDIIKPFQVIDPLNICLKIFRKLEASLQESIRKMNEDR